MLGAAKLRLGGSCFVVSAGRLARPGRTGTAHQVTDVDFTEPSATDPGGRSAPAKASPRLFTSTTSPTRVEVPWPSTRPQAEGDRPAACQARWTAITCPTGLGAVMPLPLPSLDPAMARTTAYTRSPSRSASARRFSTNRAAPSPMTNPSAPSA